MAHRHEDYDGNKPILNQVLAETFIGLPNPNDHTATQLVNFWYEKIIGTMPDNSTHNHLADFMASKDCANPVVGNHNDVIDLNDNSWPDKNQDRLYDMVATIFFTPEFIYR